MTDAIKPCPCGKVPTSVMLMGNQDKTGWYDVVPDCCQRWDAGLFTRLDRASAEAMQLAIAAWNDMPRADLQRKAYEAGYDTGYAAKCERIAELEAETKQLSELVQLLDPEVAKLEAECERLRNIERQLTDLNQTQFLELEWLRPIANAAKDLSDNAEEYDFPDGLGQGADQQYWEALDTALEPATDAIDAAIKESER